MQRKHYDEMHAADGAVRPHYRALADWLAATPAERVAEKRREADLLFHRVGITFAVYGDEQGAERLIPFDTIPRIIPLSEWQLLVRGLKQRVAALNRFLHDIYHGQEILKAGVIPAEQVLGNSAYQVAMLGLDLPHQVYSHIAGIDLIRHEDGNGSTTVANHAGPEIHWQALFAGTHPVIQIDGAPMTAVAATINGVPVSGISTTLKSGQRRVATVPKP